MPRNGSKVTHNQVMTEGQTRRFKRFFIILTVLLAIYLQNGIRHQAYTGTPDWIDACERTYVHPGRVITRSQALSANLVVVGTTQVWFKRLNIWAHSPEMVGGYVSCGVVAYVEFSENEFRAYSLSGGV
jgi:hypothetical protein